MVSKTAQLTSDDCVISLTRLQKQNGFTQADLDTHEILCHKSAYKNFFDQNILKDKFGLKFVERTLVNIDDVDTNDSLGQTVRKDGHTDFDNLQNSILTEGFRLDGIPPSAYKLKNKWYILDGRTRISIIKDKIPGGKLLINLYEKIDTKKSDDSFAFYCNTQHRRAGHATTNDLYGVMEAQINKGYFKYDSSLHQDIAGADFKEALKIYVGEHFPTMKISSPQQEKLLQHAMKMVNVSSHLLTFNSGKALENHVKTFLKIYDCPKYQYVITSSDEWEIFKTLMPVLAALEADPNNKQTIRVIVCKQKPTDVADWYKTNIRVGLKMAKHIRDAGKHFGTSPSTTKRFEIYGTVAQCHTEATRFPMDKIIEYSTITLGDYNKYGDTLSATEFQDLKNAL